LGNFQNDQKFCAKNLKIVFIFSSKHFFVFPKSASNFTEIFVRFSFFGRFGFWRKTSKRLQISLKFCFCFCFCGSFSVKIARAPQPHHRINLASPANFVGCVREALPQQSWRAHTTEVPVFGASLKILGTFIVITALNYIGKIFEVCANLRSRT
jgi:hypothetical protein